MGKLGSTDVKLGLLYMWGTHLLWESFLLYVYSLEVFYFLNESLCRLGYENAKYNFHNAKDSYHSFIYRCCCFLRYFFRCWIFFVRCPGSSALVAVRTSDPGDRFIWFLFLRGLVVFPFFVLGFLCKSSGQFCFGDCLNWWSRRSVQLVSFFKVCL